MITDILFTDQPDAHRAKMDAEQRHSWRLRRDFLLLDVVETLSRNRVTPLYQVAAMLMNYFVCHKMYTVEKDPVQLKSKGAEKLRQEYRRLKRTNRR